MSEIIRNFTAKLANHNYRILWSEAVVLSVIIGAGLASWPGVIILLSTFMFVLGFDKRGEDSLQEFKKAVYQ